MLDRLERLFGRFAVPNLALYIVMGQVFVLLARMLNLIDVSKLVFAPVLVLQGEWWRALTFLFVLPLPQSAMGYVFAVFAWYLFYMMGSALESYWGAFRFNAYVFTNFALTVAIAFFAPAEPVTNYYILASVFLAFAFLNPDFELLLFFILPLKIKWLALITWLIYALQFFTGTRGTRLSIVAAVISFALFFGGALRRRSQQTRRVATQRAERAREEAEPRHRCHVCGKTDLTNPEMDFRYCSKCAGDQCYCPEHIHNHAHVVAPENENAR